VRRADRPPAGFKGSHIPFYIRPVTTRVANQAIGVMVLPNLKRHFAMMEQLLATSPGGGKYICGDTLTGADIMLSYPLITGKNGAFDKIGSWEKGSFKATFPKLHAYIQRLADEPGWKRSMAKSQEMEAAGRKAGQRSAKL